MVAELASVWKLRLFDGNRSIARNSSRAMSLLSQEYAMHVLIVEDEALVALSLASELEACGHTIVGPTASISQAIELTRLHHPTLALMDIILDRQDGGIELARRLKQEFSVPIIFVTTQAHTASEHAALGLGFIRKPYCPEALSTALLFVRDLLENKATSHAKGVFEPFSRASVSYIH
jgi:CheY-like chemotaxis protein